MLAGHGARAAAHHQANRHVGVARQLAGLLERELRGQPHAAGTSLLQRREAAGVVHGNAGPDLGEGAELAREHQLGHVAHAARLARLDARVQAFVVDLAADLVQPGYGLAPAWPRLASRGRHVERLGRGVQPRGAGRERGGGHLGRRHQGAHLALRRGHVRTAGRGLPRQLGTHARARLPQRTRKRRRIRHARQAQAADLLARRLKNRLLKELARLRADLVHGREGHAHALVEVDLHRGRLKGARSHATHVLRKVLAGHGPGAGGLHHKALRADAGLPTGEQRRGREHHGKRLAQARLDRHPHGEAAAQVALGRALRHVHGGLGADHAHRAAGRHRARAVERDHAAGTGVLARVGGEELRGVVRGTDLQQVARAHGGVQAHVHLRHRHGAEAVAPSPAAAAADLGAAQVAAGHHGAHQLAAVVGAVVAHHVAVRAAVQVAVGEVAVEGAAQRAVARGLVRVGGLAARGQVIQLRAVRGYDGVHVVRCLHAALDLERAQARVAQAAQVVNRAEVLGTQRPHARGIAHDVALLVHQVVRQAAGLRAQAAIRAPGAGKRAQHAHAGVAEAQRAVAKALELHALARDGRDLRHAELARERHALRAQLAAPAHGPRVVHVGLRGYVALDLRPQPAHLRKQAPVLDDEAVRAQKPRLAHQRQRLGHLVGLDHDVLRHVHARTGQVSLTARLGKRLVREVVRAATRVEVASQAAEDRVGPGGERRPEGSRAPGGRQELRDVVRVPKRQRAYTSLAQWRLPDCRTQPGEKSVRSTL